MEHCIHVSLFDGRTHVWPAQTAILPCEDFVAWLRRCSGNEIASKHDNQLITTANFNGGRRCLESVESIAGLWLDNDGGCPSHHDLLDMFPGQRVVVSNTHGTHERARKYRVFIPTAQNMTSEEYARLWRGVIQHVARHFPDHTFDPAPSHAAAIFYLPCLPRSGEASDAFFIDRAGELLNIADCMTGAKLADETRMPSARVSIERILAALAQINSDDRTTWFSVLCALHHELGDQGKELGRCWSMTSRKYEPQQFERTWRSIARGKPFKPITVATILHLAKKSGTVPFQS